MPQKKKTASKAAARPTAKRASSVKKTTARRAPAKAASPKAKQSQLVTSDRELWLVLSWIVLIAIFLGIVIKAYVVG